jgi:ATP-dependent RNA helicase RhlE
VDRIQQAIMFVNGTSDKRDALLTMVESDKVARARGVHAHEA